MESDIIREAEKRDCINLAALSLDVWFRTYALDGIHSANSSHALSTYTEAYFDEVVNDPGRRLLVFSEGIYLRGYVLVDLESFYQSPDRGFEIDKLYVHGPFQSRGIGKALLDEVRQRYGQRFWLYTWVKNRSIEFYKRYGFADIGRYDFSLGDEIIENRVLSYDGTK